VKKPDYPTILMQADWDKKKGVIAKMHGKTGIGPKMREAYSFFNMIQWPKLEVPTEGTGWSQFHRVEWYQIAEAAVKEVNDRVFHETFRSLDELRNLAAGVRTQFNNSATIPASSTRHVGDVATAAGKLADALNPATVLENVKKEFDAVPARLQQSFVDPIMDNLRKVVGRNVFALTQVRANPTVGYYKYNGWKLFRDVSVQMNNLVQAEEKSFDVGNVDIRAAKDLLQRVRPYADEGKLPTCDEDVGPLIKKLEDVYDDVKHFVGV